MDTYASPSIAACLSISTAAERAPQIAKLRLHGGVRRVRVGARRLSRDELVTNPGEEPRVPSPEWPRT